MTQLEWRRASPNPAVVKNLERMVSMTAGIIRKDIKNIQKQILEAKKIRNV